MYKLTIFSSIYILFQTHAISYVGPGMGGGLIAATIGVVVALLVSIFALLWFPIKKILKKKKQNNLESNKSEEEKNK